MAFWLCIFYPASSLWVSRDEELDGLFTFVSSGRTKAIIDVKSMQDSI